MPVLLDWFGPGVPECLECGGPVEDLNYQWQKDNEDGWVCKKCWYDLVRWTYEQALKGNEEKKIEQ